MRPINLKIQAFGPFKDLIEIDFSKFSTKGLFLLTGKTGAGKTSIFDAISYALFDCASGNNRNKDNIRSDYASSKVRTFVELTFVHNAKEYKILRYPSYLKDGNTSKTNADASITCDGVTVTGLKNVNNEIIDILGIDAKQFKQIAMIAQGEFQDLLFANSVDRSKIFSSIFDTSIYGKVSEIIKNKFSAINRDYKDNKIIFDNEVDNIDWELTVDDTSTVLDLLEEYNKKDEIEVKRVNEQTTSLNNIITTLNSELNIAKIDNDNIIKRDEKDKLFNELKSNYDRFSKLKIEIEEQRKLVPILETKEKLEKDIKDCKDIILTKSEYLDKLNIDFKQIKADYETVGELNQELQKISKILDVINNNNIILEKIKKIVLVRPIEVDYKNIKNLEEITTNKDIIGLYEKEKLIFNNDKDELRRLEVSLKKIQEDEEKLVNKNTSLMEIKNKYNKLSEEINNLENVLLNNRAAAIALELKDDCPCLVCGSRNHPKLAKYDDNFDINELNNKNSLLKQVTLEKESIANEVFALDKIIKESNKEDILKNINNLSSKDYKINEYRIKYEEYLKACNELEIMNKKAKKYEDELRVYNECLVNKKVLEESIVKVDYEFTKNDYDLLDNKITNITKNYNDIFVEINNLNTQISGLNNNKEKYTLELNKIDNELKNKVCWTKEEFIRNLEETNNYFNEYNKTETILNDLFVRTKDKVLINIDTLEEKLNNKKEELNNLDKNIIIKYSNNVKVYNKLLSIKKEFIKIEKKYSTYKILSETANGNINGKSKINFEQFVQSYYFDEVIRNSNIRLNSITSGRYELLKKSNSYLELNVIDYYTGKVRDVKTLSGGEVFKSSLALALGMSDTIGSYAGGIKIDTLFIDEGFGSLDSDSLEAAISTLTELSSDKLVGIISHVEELKNRIDKKILITSSNEGSSVNIEI